jgi:OFA family oxalate/formate antiporter-like MFS transporter
MNTPMFQLIASFFTMVMIGNLQYTWTVFVEPMRDAQTWALSSVQTAAAIYLAVQTWVQPFNGWVIDKIGQRGFITVAGFLVGIGWSMMGRASSLTELYLFYGMAGVGAAFVYSGAMGSALKWFPYRRGFASGITAAGYGGGSALFVFINGYLIKTYGYREAFLATGILQGVVIVIVAQFLRHPGKDFNPPKPLATAATTKSRRGTEDWTSPQMLRTPVFYLMYVMFIFMGVGGIFLATGLGPLTRTWKLTAILTTAQALGLICNALSRPFWGWISDRRGRENTMIVAFFLQAIALISVVQFGRSSELLFVMTICFAYFTWGEIYALFPSTVGDYFGTKNATSNNAFLYSAKGVSGLFGTSLAALLFEHFGGWGPVFYISAGLALASCIMAGFLRTRPLPAKPSAMQLAAATNP